MKKSTNVFLAILAFSALSIAVLSMFVNRATINVKATSSGRGAENVLVLSSKSLVTSNSYTVGDFEVTSPNGNALSFSYIQGKSNENGLITLNKTYVGNAFDNLCYLGNNDPIASVTSIDVNFDGGTLVLFASNDNSRFYKVDVLTETTSTVLGNGYLYYRFANGNHSINNEININSITFNYQCNLADDTSEASDMSNVFTLNGAASLAGGVALDTTTHSDAYNSTQSLKFTSPVTADQETYVMSDSTSSRWQFGFHLPRAMNGSELHNMKLSFLCNSELTSKGDNKVVELSIYPSTHYWKYEDSALRVKAYLTAEHVGWYEMSLDFSSSSTKLNSDTYKDTEFTYLFIRPNHVAPVGANEKGYLFIDELRLEYVHNYPEFDSSAIDASEEESNDLSNNAYVAGYSCSDGDLDYAVRSKNSYRSRIVTPSDDTCRWHYNGFLVDMAGKVLSFDIKMESASAYMKVSLFHNDGGTDYRYTVTARYGTEAGVSIENYTGDYVGWKHIVINFDDAMSSATKDQKPSSSPANFGFVLAHSTGISAHIDNIRITDK